MAIRKIKIDGLYVPDEPEDSLDHLDLSKAVPAKFPNLKLSTETISLRVPLTLLNTIKIEANRQDIPYQSLIKIALAERFDRHFIAQRQKYKRTKRGIKNSHVTKKA